MKRMFFVFFLTAIFFASLPSFGRVRIKPKTDTIVVAEQKQYSAEETAAANLVRKANKINKLANENLIKPGQKLVYPYPSDNDRLNVTVIQDDYQLKIAKKINAGGYNPGYHFVLDSTLQIPEKQKASEDSVVFTLEPETKNYTTLLWFLVICLIVFIAFLIFKFLKAIKEKENIAGQLENMSDSNWLLGQELEETRNKLPIEAPEVVDSEWLKQNNPVGNDITNSSSDLVQETIARVYGKKPDFIAQAMVTTGENAISMNFSHNRTAKTGLNNVVVYLGWNWDLEKNAWIEVGMIASACSNGFEVNPERVEKMASLFVFVELAKKNQHPVVYSGGTVPEGTIYPELVKELVIKYHEANITDLRKAGMLVEIPKN